MLWCLEVCVALLYKDSKAIFIQINKALFKSLHLGGNTPNTHQLMNSKQNVVYLYNGVLVNH